MLIYQHREQSAVSGDVLARLIGDLDAVRTHARSDHDDVIDLLIRYGELEAAVLDAEPTLPQGPWRHAATSIASAFVASADGRDPASCIRRFASDLSGVRAAHVPRAIKLRTSEGFAYHALFPDTFIDAARRYVLERRPTAVCCIGIRTIGAALSAVSAAAMEERGVTVTSITVRPGGHPFARELTDAAPLDEVLACPGAHSLEFAIIDEGPGLSGSTFMAVAEALRARGVAPRRIALFPSWVAEASQLNSALAREKWSDYAVYVGSQNRQSGTDLSAGRWRRYFLRNATACPPVHPQHERLKYLDGSHVRRFAGLGHYGRRIRRRAELLAAAGFTPRVVDVRMGMLSVERVPGVPFNRPDAPVTLVHRAADYLSCVARLETRSAAATMAPLRDMTTTNVREALGDAAADAAAQVMDVGIGFSSPEVAVDGRMLPHEWILTPDQRWVKVDAWDHHANDFFPGCTDIAWDLAGTIAELRLGRAATAQFVDRFVSSTRDHEVRRRVPVYLVAYLAFRTGYASLAAASLGATVDGDRFGELGARYRAQLKKAITAVAPNVRRT